MEMCHCGKPLHYTDKKLEAAVSRLQQKHGDILMGYGNRYWLVPRHYQALHKRIDGQDLEKLGFKEVIVKA